MEVNDMLFMKKIREYCTDDAAYTELASVIECLRKTDVRINYEADLLTSAFTWRAAGNALGIQYLYFAKWFNSPITAPQLKDFILEK